MAINSISWRLNTSTTNSNPQTWIPPQQNVIKTNTVAAFAEVKTGSGSVIARSDMGKLWFQLFVHLRIGCAWKLQKFLLLVMVCRWLWILGISSCDVRNKAHVQNYLELLAKISWCYLSIFRLSYFINVVFHVSLRVS